MNIFCINFHWKFLLFCLGLMIIDSRLTPETGASLIWRPLPVAEVNQWWPSTDYNLSKSVIKGVYPDSQLQYEKIE